MSSNGRNRGYIGRNEITSPKGVIDGRQSYLNKEVISNNYGPDWARPADWLQIPGYTFGEQVAYGLLAVTNDEVQSNSVGLTIRGNYTVDWGDGTIESFADNTTVRRSYDFNSISSSTETTEGFRQVLIKVTPQSGANLTNINFGVAGITTAGDMPTKWLELNWNIPNATVFTVRNNPYVKKIFINRCGNPSVSLTTMGYQGLLNLESFYIPPTVVMSGLASTILGSLKLKQLPILNTSSITSFSSVFLSSRIETLPNWNYSSATNIDQFARFSYLKYIPFVFSCPNVTSSSTPNFFSAGFLEYVKGINLPNLTNCTAMFLNCSSLTTIEGLTLSKATNITNLFSGCGKLETIGSFDGGTGIQNATTAFNGCASLKTAPRLNLSNCTNATQMFANCTLLENVPGYTFGNNAILTNMFGGCSSLRKLPSMDFSNISILDTGVGTAQRFTANCTALESFPVKNLRVSWNLTNSRFGFTALSEIFSGLSGASGGSATLNITGNPGATFITAAQIAGATALGWTITR